MDMNNNISNNIAYGPEHLAKSRNVVLALYILFISGLFTGGLTLIASLILGHMKESGSVGTIYNSHIRAYLKVVWVDMGAFFLVPLAGLSFFFTLSTYAGIALGVALTSVCLLIGIALWSIYRIVKGLWCWYKVHAVT